MRVVQQVKRNQGRRVYLDDARRNIRIQNRHIQYLWKMFRTFVMGNSVIPRDQIKNEKILNCLLHFSQWN